MSIRPEKHVWDKTWGQDSKKVQISHTDKMIFNYPVSYTHLTLPTSDLV